MKQTRSAGGVVIRRGEDRTIFVALEQQIGHSLVSDVWFIPKGHIEEGESIEDAARREVAEEAGVQGASIIRKLGVKYRVSSHDPNEMKEIHYFLMETEVEALLPIATDKDHRGAWFPLFDTAIDVGYDEQREILEVVRQIVRKSQFY